MGISGRLPAALTQVPARQAGTCPRYSEKILCLSYSRGLAREMSVLAAGICQHQHWPGASVLAVSSAMTATEWDRRVRLQSC